MNALDLMKQDHEKAKKLFATLEDTTERALKTREATFKKLKQELIVHTHIEEVVFYPAIEPKDETHDITLEAFEEHKVAKLLLGELDQEEKDTEEWGAKLKVLRENVEHHIGEEEGEMFAAVKKIMRKDELEELGEQMEKEKRGMIESLS